MKVPVFVLENQKPESEVPAHFRPQGMKVYISIVHLSLIAVQVWLYRISSLEVPPFASHHFDFWSYEPGLTTKMLYNYSKYFLALPFLNSLAYLDIVRRERLPLWYATVTVLLSILSVVAIIYLLHEGLFNKVGEKLWYLPDRY